MQEIRGDVSKEEVYVISFLPFMIDFLLLFLFPFFFTLAFVYVYHNLFGIKMLDCCYMM
jgi:hypothetical protein